MAGNTSILMKVSLYTSLSVNICLTSYLDRDIPTTIIDRGTVRLDTYVNRVTTGFGTASWVTNIISPITTAIFCFVKIIDLSLILSPPP